MVATTCRGSSYGEALELLLTGDFVSADEAHRIGMVNRVVDDADLGGGHQGVAEQIAAAPPVTVRMIKRATYQSANADLRTSLDLISSHFAVVAATDDAAEALSAMQEKRVPSFHGR